MGPETNLPSSASVHLFLTEPMHFLVRHSTKLTRQVTTHSLTIQDIWKHKRPAFLWNSELGLRMMTAQQENPQTRLTMAGSAFRHKHVLLKSNSQKPVYVWQLHCFWLIESPLLRVKQTTDSPSGLRELRSCLLQSPTRQQSPPDSALVRASEPRRELNVERVLSSHLLKG